MSLPFSVPVFISIYLCPCLYLFFLYVQATREFSAFVSPSMEDEWGHDVLRLSMGRMLDVLLSNMEVAAAAAEVAAAAQAAAAAEVAAVGMAGSSSSSKNGSSINAKGSAAGSFVAGGNDDGDGSNGAAAAASNGSNGITTSSSSAVTSSGSSSSASTGSGQPARMYLYSGHDSTICPLAVGEWHMISEMGCISHLLLLHICLNTKS